MWVIIRNPKTMNPEELLSATDGGAGVGEDGKVTDRKAARANNPKIIAKLAIAARAYDATVEPSYDPLSGEPTGNTEQPLLPPTPWTPETAARLPTEITLKIVEVFAEAMSPPK